MIPHPSYRILIPWIEQPISKNFTINKQTNIILNHCVPNNFLFISVFAALIYVRSHANVPFHHLQIKILMFHQYLLEKFIRIHHHHRSSHHFIVIRKCEIFLDCLLSTDYISKFSPRSRISLSTFHFLLFIFAFLLPLTFATKLPSATNIDLFLFSDYAFAFSLNFSSQTPHWHVGCCLHSNQTMCDSISFSSHSIFISNDSTSEEGTFLWDDAYGFIDNRHFMYRNNSTI